MGRRKVELWVALQLMEERVRGEVSAENKKKKHIVSISALKMWFSHCPNIA